MSKPSHGLHVRRGRHGVVGAEERAGAGTAGEEADLRLGQLLGSGRHGLVFGGTHGRGECRTDVAVKIPNLPGGLDDEGRALERFAHPAVVELLGGPLSNGALVLEHCDLGTLSDRLREGTLTTGEISTMARAIVPALQHVHEQGWIHGDISPANIGLRTNRGPALLDFATARRADGSPVAEGTAEFAGPLRQADPRLDVRAFAATLLAALGTPDRWDHRKRRVFEQLTDLLIRCDGAAAVDVAEILEITDASWPTANAGTSGGGPDVNQPTRAFGPSPATAAAAANDETPRARVVAGVGLSAIIVIALFLEVLSAFSLGSHEDPEVALVREHPASHTLERAGAVWDQQTGVVTTADRSGRSTFAAGEPGDLAAIGDWNCDGVETLGVFRPSTGAFFAFDSWADRAVAQARHLGEGAHLVVRTDPTGCSVPVVRSANPVDQ